MPTQKVPSTIRANTKMALMELSSQRLRRPVISMWVLPGGAPSFPGPPLRIPIYTHTPRPC